MSRADPTKDLPAENQRSGPIASDSGLAGLPEAFSRESSDAEAAEEGVRWRAFADRYIGEYFQWEPTAAAEAGYHEFDGQLPDWSETGLRDRRAWLHRVRGEAQSFEPGRLTSSAAFERSYLLATVDSQIFWFETAKWPNRNPAFYVDALDPDLYLTRNYAPPDVRFRAFAEYARQIPEAVAQIRANLCAPMADSYASFGRATFRGLAFFFNREATAAFCDLDDCRLVASCEEVCAVAARSLERLAVWFEELEGGGEEGFALGEPVFEEMLRATEGINVDLARLESIGEEELERNLEELQEACTRFGYRTSPSECVLEVRSRKPANGVLTAAREQVARLESFVRERGIVTIPDHPAVEVEESPRYMRWNSAYVRIPGPNDAHLPATYYITPPNPSWTPEERLGYVPGRADLLFASVHEVWPGHVLQFLHSNRAPWQVGQLFVGYGFAEGWAHYAEEMVWEQGLDAEEPEAHVAKVMNALVRTTRFLVALRLHAGSMGVEEAERFFRERAFLDAASARQQAARGTFDPAYLNYTLGKLLIRKLRDDWKRTQDARGDWREFHDRILSYGGPPLPLVREAMLGPDSGPPL